MLTIFSLPKAFRGHIKTIQDNAIQSWLKLDPGCEIILLGDDEGTAEAADRFGVRYYPGIDRNEYGTPLVSSVFDKGQSLASNDVVCYINADIILMSDFMPAIIEVMEKKVKFLIIGRRWDIDIEESVNFNEAGWEKQIRKQLSLRGKLHGRAGFDYFIFTRGLYSEIPPFAIGRTAWDNWLIYRARCLGAPVIDATRAVVAVHQNHDYSHNSGGTAGVWKGPEAVKNRDLAGGKNHDFNVDHATHVLTLQGMRRAISLRHLYFRVDALPVLRSELRFLQRPVKRITESLAKVRLRLGLNG